MKVCKTCKKEFPVLASNKSCIVCNISYHSKKNRYKEGMKDRTEKVRNEKQNNIEAIRQEYLNKGMEER